MPKWKIIEVFTGKPEGPNEVYDGRGGHREERLQLHWVGAGTGEIKNRQLKRAAFLEHFANREPCLIGMGACGGSQHWARRLMEMGHQVKLMPAMFVKAFNIGNKNDPADTRAIWMATQMPSKAVAVKTEARQAVPSVCFALLVSRRK